MYTSHWCHTCHAEKQLTILFAMRKKTESCPPQRWHVYCTAVNRVEYWVAFPAVDRFPLTHSLLFSSFFIHGKAYAKYLVKTFGPEQEENTVFALESIHFIHLLTHKYGLSTHSVVPNLWDPMPEDVGWSWCNNTRNQVHNKYNALESSPNHTPSPQSIEKFSSIKRVPDAENIGDSCIRWWALC